MIEINIVWLILIGGIIGGVFFLSGYVICGAFQDNQTAYIAQLENENEILNNSIAETNKLIDEHFEK